jgi:acetone carboxylase gamma subunit
MTIRISETLEIREKSAAKHICCRGCGHALAPAGKAWKPHAKLTTLPIKKVPGSSSAVDAQAVFRQFNCPHCGRLLDSETALPEDPFLEDIVMV